MRRYFWPCNFATYLHDVTDCQCSFRLFFPFFLHSYSTRVGNTFLREIVSP